MEANVVKQIVVKQIVVNGHSKKPLLVLTAPPVMGHTTPLLRLSKEMGKRGFEVIFMSTLEFKKSIEKTGAEFYESTTPFADINYLKSRHTLPPGLPTLMADMENMFIKQMAPRSVELRGLLEFVREREPGRNVVIITETMSLAPMPFLFGAPLPRGYDKFPKTINVNTTPIMLLSIDTGITGPCLPPDASESGRARNKIMNEMLVRGPFSGTDRVFHETLKGLGCTSLPKVFFQNAWLDSYDTTFQLCPPSLEYPRSDLALSIRFSGSLPKGEIPADFPYPSWWSEITANSALPAAERKKVVAVVQGTVQLDYTDLIIPTLKALGPRPDVIVVSILGVRGASLASVEGFEVPTNARVVDFLPYDAILEHADVFISNGGYGGVTHGVLNGVPLILAGVSEDKAEACARGAYAGFAINLKVQRPTSEQIYAAADRIFTDGSFKHAALRLMHENEDLDAMSIFERQILKYAKA
ncbi:putative glycosyltransferase [Xylariales sp. PMI_506]|nr:putative glycosyltransferase [Xylariales sp. PMI_506]